MGNGVSAVFSSLGQWLAQPYSPQMSAKDWFLFGGLVIVIVGVWLMILRELRGAIE